MKEYNPQGGSLPHLLLPGVASYRRQPRAIESTTPMGLPYYYPLIIMPPHVISSHHLVGLPYYYPLITTLQRGISSHPPDGVAVSLSIHHYTITRDIITPPDGVAHIIAYLSQPQPRG